ncbi:MAG: hypothetical protein ACXVAX_04825 [Pseudobdellovibrio sp.]
MLNAPSLKLKLLFFILLQAGFAYSFAQTSEVSAPAVSTPDSNSTGSAAEGTSVTKNKKNKQNQDLVAHAGFSLTSINYASDSNLNDTNLQQIEVDLNLKKAGRFFTNTEVVMGTFSIPNSFYYALPEAYVGYGDRSASVTFGRKLENYSFADSFFNFGLVQPYTSNDFINYYPSGLTGVAAHFFSGGFGFDASYNPVYIPNQGPQVKIVDGKAVASSRWAPVPPSQFRFGDQNRDINYAFKDYSLSDIVSSQGYILHGFIGDNKQRPTFSYTYGHLPINDIAVSRETFGDIATFSGNVLLTPVVLYHEIYAVDLNIDSGNIKTSFSFVGDRPENKTAPDSEAIQTLSPLQIYSAYVGVDLKKYFDRPMEIYVAGAQIAGGDIQDLGSNGQPSSVSYASSRTLYKTPIRMGVKGDVAYIANRPLSTDVNYTYDAQLKGSLLSASVKYYPVRNLNVNAGFDLIGVQEDDANLTQSNFLDQNKANDRFSAGVGYVF